MLALAYIAAILLGYFCGSLPTGFLVAKAKGIDIRAVGSGNIGATNVFRILGKAAGVFVLITDALKGLLPVVWLAPALAFMHPNTDTEWLRIAAGISAILGHNYTCWLRFKGGKGIATSAGAFLGLTPGPLGIAFAVWVITFASSRYVSLASIFAAAALPLATWCLPFGLPLRIITTVIGALAIFKHRANIQRLLAGTENRIGARKKQELPS